MVSNQIPSWPATCAALLGILIDRVPMSNGVVTRKSLSEVLILHRSPEQGGYWHVVAGGVELGEAVEEAAERELLEETGLDANVTAGIKVVEYAYPLSEEPADRRSLYDPSVVKVEVTCFHVTAPDEWEPSLTGSMTVTAGANRVRRFLLCVGRRPPGPSESS
jgi:8-oxo-dGTP pyrophosphatase MutT (NUDIX family)